MIDELNGKTFDQLISSRIDSEVELIPLDHFFGEGIFSQSRVFCHSFGFLPRVGTKSTIGTDKRLFGKDINGLGKSEGVLIDDRDTG